EVNDGDCLSNVGTDIAEPEELAGGVFPLPETVLSVRRIKLAIVGNVEHIMHDDGMGPMSDQGKKFAKEVLGNLKSVGIPEDQAAFHVADGFCEVEVPYLASEDLTGFKPFFWRELLQPRHRYGGPIGSPAQTNDFTTDMIAKLVRDFKKATG